MDRPSYVRNCQVILRRGDGPLFAVEDGLVVARLDGYTILPNEDYARLSGKSSPTNPPEPSSST